jgi:hypothetical protein
MVEDVALDHGVAATTGAGMVGKDIGGNPATAVLLLGHSF